MNIGGFGNRRKPRQFEFKAMYWDEEAERREEMRKAAELSDPNYKPEDDSYAPGSLIRAGRVRRMRSAQKAQKKGGSTLIRTLIFLILLGAILFIFADYISFMR